MGNQLVSSVKTVIRPIEYYLAEVPDIKLRSSLGQTQFLKVALCHRDREGDVVVKVLSHEDPSLLLDSVKAELLAFARVTHDNASIASFRIVEIRPNFAYIVRQYVRFSLYDRLSTRPFLVDIEKAWIVYQIFRSLAWCHARRIYHGDIKLENILVTSSLWVIVTDFATYKPVNLPEDNPSFFNYFFDTSRRRCCNIAPERFVPSASLAQMDNNPSAASNQLFISESPQPDSQQPDTQPSSATAANTSAPTALNEAMDMFSVGCILVEIFSDNFLFDYGNLLLYKAQRLDRTKLENKLRRIECVPIRELITNLISLDAAKRKSASAVLDDFRGTLFPGYFAALYTISLTLVRLSPDSKILYLAQELPNYSPLFVAKRENAIGILILLSTITSSIRSLTHVHCKIQAQRLMIDLIRAAPAATLSPFIIDRLVPYLADALANDRDHRVRGEALRSLTSALEMVDKICPSDSNIFTDYLMDTLRKSLECEKSIYVHTCMAQIVGRLAAVAYAFLNQTSDQNYDAELEKLHEDFRKIVYDLLTHANMSVRRALMVTPRNCAQLCNFFGRQKTSELLLPHILTFLNVKQDFQIRLSFFDSMIVLTSYLGVQCAHVLPPLLNSGLFDADEIVIGKAIESIATLVEQGLLQRSNIYDLLQDMLPLLYHPNRWIVHAIVHFFAVLADHMTMIDLHCKVLPMIAPYLSRNVHSLANRHLLLDSLNPGLTRNILDIVFLSKDAEILETLFSILRNKSSGINNAPYKRLCAENIDRYVERQLLLLSDLIVKMYRNRKICSIDYDFVSSVGGGGGNNKNNSPQYYESIIECENRDGRLSRVFYLYDPDRKDFANSFMSGIGVSSSSNTNPEWQHMFGPHSTTGDIGGTQSGAIDALAPSEAATEAREIEIGIFECPPASADLVALRAYKRRSFKPPITANTVMNTGGSGGGGGDHFRPRGILVSHLYEHRASVNAMARYGSTSCFFTASDDGTIRLWDLATFESRNVITRSRYLFKMEFSNGYAINFKGVICCGPHVVTYTNDGIVYIFECRENSLQLVCNFKVGSSKATIPLLVTSICALSANVFALSLTNSLVYGYDIRRINTKEFFVPIFKVALAPHHRTITSIDGNEVVLFLATATGKMAGFDLRFKLKVTEFDHSSSTIVDGADGFAPSTQTVIAPQSPQPLQAIRVTKIRYTPEGLYASTHGSRDITLWDYKLGHRIKILRCSRAPGSGGSTATDPASSSSSAAAGQIEKSPPTVNAILPIVIGRHHASSSSSSSSSSSLRNSTAIITGGSDMRIRYWDMQIPEKSYTISDPMFKCCSYLGASSHSASAASSSSSSTAATTNANLSPQQNNNAKTGSGSSSGAINHHHHHQSVSGTQYTSLYYDHSTGMPSIASYITKRIADRQLIEELDTSAQFAAYNSKHCCSLDQQSIESGHQDAITDLLRVNQYLISSGRNGTVKVWR